MFCIHLHYDNDHDDDEISSEQRVTSILKIVLKIIHYIIYYYCYFNYLTFKHLKKSSWSQKCITLFLHRVI